MGEFLQNNWFWIVVVLLFIGMHASGMGCCGQGRHAGRGDPRSKRDDDQP